MRQSEKRDIAIGAIRSHARSIGVQPEHLMPDDALHILDDIARTEGDLVASQWYREASNHQIRLFRRDWLKWVGETNNLLAYRYN